MYVVVAVVSGFPMDTYIDVLVLLALFCWSVLPFKHNRKQLKDAGTDR